MDGGILLEIKIISCNKTQYKPTLPKRAVDIQANKLQQEDLEKARERTKCTTTLLLAPSALWSVSWWSWAKSGEL